MNSKICKIKITKSHKITKQINNLKRRLEIKKATLKY